MRAHTASVIPLCLVICACGSKPAKPTVPVEAARPAAEAGSDKPPVAALVLDGIPEVPPRIRRKLHRYLSARQTRFGDWNRRRGGMLLLTRFGNTQQIFRVGQPGGVRRQLTFFDDPVSAARIEPRSYDGSLMFLKDRKGSEANQLYRAQLLEGSVSRLSAGGQARTTRFCLAADATVAFNSTARNGRDFDIYLVEPGATQAKPVYRANGMFVPLDFSPNGRELLLLEILSRNASRLHLLDLRTKKARAFEPHSTDKAGRPQAEAISYRDALWTRDGKGILFTSDAMGEFVQLYLYELKRGRLWSLTPDIPHDIEQLTLSLNGRTAAFSTNVDGYSQLHLLDVRRRRHVPIELEQAIISDLRFSRDKRRSTLLGFTLSKPTGASDAYGYDTRTRRLTRWVESEVGGINSDFFVEPKLVRYPTFDQVRGEPRTIPAFYFKPPGPGPHPVLIQLHRNPEGQYRPRFDPLLQYLVMDMGVAVVAPNIRGSSGYGRSYLRLDDGRKRMDAVKDIGALLDWIAARPELDQSKVVLKGASYGGFLVLATMARYGQRVRGGIDQVGISNFLSFLKNTKRYRRALRRAEYGDERRKSTRLFLKRISPLYQASKIRAPLLVIQGANDPRVPRSESRRLVQALRAKGRKVWYMLARDEGHRFRRKENRDVAHFVIAHFLETLGVGKQK